MNLTEIKRKLKRKSIGKSGNLSGTLYKFNMKEAKFNLVKIQSSPDQYYVNITIGEYEYGSYQITITHKEIVIYKFDVEIEYNDRFIVLKDYDKDTYFNYSMYYDLPSPEELKEIRKYFVKYYKNHSADLYFKEK